MCVVSNCSYFANNAVLQCQLTSSSAIESGNSPSWAGCGAIVSGLTDEASFELSASEMDAFFSRFGRRPNRDAAYTCSHITININTQNLQ